jgi:hypothetical protein
MKFLPIAIALLFGAGFLVSSSAQAAGSKSKSSKKATPAPAADTSDKITAVHLASITINLFATHAGKEYKVTPATKITVNGQPSQLSGLATGMDVVVTPAPDGVTAASIDAKTPKR